MQAWGTNLLSRKSMCLQAHCTACTQLCGPSEGILHSAWLQALLSETHKSKAQAHWVSPNSKSFCAPLGHQNRMLRHQSNCSWL